MLVLVVDDDRTSLRVLEKAVAELSYEVITANDGLAAWNILRQRDVRMVIADWEMPGMNGLSLCRRLRAGILSHYVFTVILTSKANRDDIIQGLEAGADDYITKPFDRAELSARLRSGRRIIDLEQELSSKNEMLKDLNSVLEHMTLTDPLMEIGNRRGFFDTLERLHGAPGINNSGYALIMCDVDNFKAYNDTYGHAAGDAVLKDVSAALRKSLRSNDRIFRYGGEEIVVYLSGADVTAGYEVAERLCRAVEALCIPHAGNGPGIVTVSCGVAAGPEEADAGRDWESILSLADEALYKAKAAGRNRVEAAAG